MTLFLRGIYMRTKHSPKHVAPKASKKHARLKLGKNRKGLIIRISIAAAAILLIVLIAVGFVNSKLNKLGKADISSTPMMTGEKFEIMYDEETSLEESSPKEDIASLVEDESSLKDDDSLELKESGSKPATGDVLADKNIINILLLGTDMKMENTNDPGRCDATMIVSLNKRTGEVKVVNFERSMGVPIPDYGDTMLTYAYQYGGGTFMEKLISECFLVDLTGYAHAGYETFPAVIDAIGGLDMELTLSEAGFINEFLKYNVNRQSLVEGMNHLNGLNAYTYCHHREYDSDWARQARVGRVIAAILEKAKTLKISELNKLMDKVLPMIDTDLTKAEITSLIASSPKFINATFDQIMLPNRENTWKYVGARDKVLLGCDYSECAESIKKFIYGE